MFLVMFLTCLRQSLQQFSHAVPFTIISDSKEFFSLQEIKISTQLHIGTPFQTLTVLFDTGSANSWIMEPKLFEASKDSIFNSSLSSTYHLIYKQSSFLVEEKIISAYKFIDNITIGSISLSPSILHLSTHIRTEYGYSSIGLGKETYKLALGPSFMSQLISNNRIKSNQFTFEYSSDDRGVITFGETDRASKPFLSLAMNDSPLFIVSALNITTAFISLVQGDISIQFDEAYGFIEMYHKNSRDILRQIFHEEGKDFIDQCQWLTYKRTKAFLMLDKKFSYLLCLNAFEESSLDAVTFYFDSGSLSLSSRDLFMTYNRTHKIGAIIVQHIKGIRAHDWVIGRPLLKNYKIEFNSDENKVHFYERDRSRQKEMMILAICQWAVLLSGIALLRCIDSTINKKNYFALYLNSARSEAVRIHKYQT